MKAQWQLAAEWLEANPQYHNYGSKMLSQVDGVPNYSRFVWRMARKALNLPDAPRSNSLTANRNYPKKRKGRVLPRNTRSIRIDVLTGMVTDTVNGEPTTVKVRHVYQIVRFYEHLKYGAIWLNNTTILLVKSKRKANKAA